MIFPAIVFPFGVYLTFIYYSTSLPQDILDAARVYGCNEFDLFRFRGLPLATPLLVLLSFVSVIIVGLGSLRGTLVAALFVGLLDGILSTAFFFPPTFAKIVATLAVALVLVFRPQGLFGKAAA